MPTNRKAIHRILAMAFIGAILALAANIASFYYSPEITVCEFVLTVEEGLVVMQVPLVAHADDLPYANSIYVYSRDNAGWKIPGSPGAKMGMRSLIALLKAPPPPGTFRISEKPSAILNYDFGYWVCEWYRPERPGKSLSTIAPLWVPFVIIVLIYLAFSFGYIRFSIRSLLGFTMAVAILLWLMV